MICTSHQASPFGLEVHSNVILLLSAVTFLHFYTTVTHKDDLGTHWITILAENNSRPSNLRSDKNASGLLRNALLWKLWLWKACITGRWGRVRLLAQISRYSRSLGVSFILHLAESRFKLNREFFLWAILVLEIAGLEITERLFKQTHTIKNSIKSMERFCNEKKEIQL